MLRSAILATLFGGPWLFLPDLPAAQEVDALPPRPPAFAPVAETFTWADFDGDGLSDAFVARADGSGHLLRNAGEGRFEDVTQRAGLADATGIHQAAWADFDGDGALDLFLAGYAGASRLMRQLPDGAFEDVARAVGIAVDEPARRAEWIDFDADGRPDLHLTTAGADLVFHNRGGRSFEQLELELGPPGPPPATLRVARPVLERDAAAELAAPAAERSEPRADRRLPIHAAPHAGGGPDGFLGGGGSAGSYSAACSPSIEDQGVPGNCLMASSVPMEGLLYPLSEDLFVDLLGEVGIGTLSPTRKLHVEGRVYAHTSSLNHSAFRALSDAGKAIYGESAGSYPTAHFEQHGGGAVMECEYQDELTFEVRSGGGVRAWSSSGNAAAKAENTGDGHALYGINASGDATLRVRQEGSGKLLVAEDDTQDLFWVRNEGGITSVCTNGSSNLGLSTALYANNTSGTNEEGNAILARAQGTGTTIIVDQHGSGNFMKGRDSNGDTLWRITNTGRVVTTALQITGGGDLVEGFESEEGLLEPGTVVVIDPERPGRLIASTRAYDTKVAGAVSGAGGVRHGIRMGQDDVLDGDNLVAMAGRIYVKCSAENGSIEPGDLLTTASLAGHAMKAGDPGRSFGSVIGKAMSSLDEGTGLVLVLVNLQ